MAVIYLFLQRGLHRHRWAGLDAPDLASEAMRLARMLADLAPDEPEVLGLQALLEICRDPGGGWLGRGLAR